MPQITYNRVTIAIDGDQAVITFAGASGLITVRIPASQLERWCLKMLRQEALA